jgi:hypothetical protein
VNTLAPNVLPVTREFDPALWLTNPAVRTRVMNCWASWLDECGHWFDRDAFDVLFGNGSVKDLQERTMDDFLQFMESQYKEGKL